MVYTRWNFYAIDIYSAVPLERGQCSHQHSQKTPHSSPVRARYEMSFVGSPSVWYPGSSPAIMYAISYHIGTRYNGTQLYIYILAYPRGAVQHLLVRIPKKHTNNLVLRCRKTVKCEVLCGPETDSVFVPLLLALYIRIAIEPSIFRRGISGSTLSRRTVFWKHFHHNSCLTYPGVHACVSELIWIWNVYITCLEVPRKS